MKKFIVLFMAVFALTLVACGGDDGVEYPVEYTRATVVSSNVDGDTVKLTVEGEGFYPMTAEVTFVNGTMTAFEITDHRETANWGEVLIDAGDLQQAIIDNQSNISGIDLGDYVVVAGGTVSATAEALIDIASTAVEHFGKHYE